jgi:hypothetical protein
LKILIESLFFQFFFNYIYNCLQTFNFTQFHPYQSQLSTPKLTAFSFWSLVLNLCIWLSIDQQTFIFFKLAPDLVIYNLYINAFFPVWYLVLDFFN